ncbi:ATP-binding protein [Massilia soli]|uniref:histidine kinase n=1 Tax=Massilia soli TaxID=2792854 RepID=A0ABS7SQ58_9BURK|nr:ATP-binding protein [Massilia soli]MBZ2207887.1 response regulator [Massilia soli]
MIRMHSLRHKLSVVVMLTTLASLLVSIAIVIAYDLRQYHRALLGDMSTQAELLGHMTSAALSFDDQRLAAENLALLRIRPQVRAGAIYNARGQLFASYAAPGEARAFPARALGDNIQIEGSNLFLYRRIIENGELLGTVYLRADYSLVARALDYVGVGLLVTLVAMLLAFLLTRRLGRIVTAPIFAIAEVAREVVSTRDYSRRAPRTSTDEAGELVDSFNAMLTEIEQRTGELETSNRAIAREAEERARAQQEVMRLNGQLEVRVHERTLQLETANAELELAMEEAKEANQAKSAFLSAMSHELRTPLNAILGFAQILTSDALPSTLPQKKEFAGHILKSGRHLLTLINEILDLAKVEAGAVNLSLEPVALGDVMGECRSMIEPIAAQRGIRVLFPEARGTVVEADRTRLKQVLLNLLSNAVKYNRDAGAVVVDIAFDAPGKVRIAVQDTGLGLRPDQLDLLFQPFNRLGQESSGEEGTGIGLVVTRRLVELMNGAIGVSSRVGIGSVFWIELPVTAPHALSIEGARAPALPADAPDAGTRHTLLYIEDNPANLKLVEEIVRFRPDLRLLAAQDGHLGIEMAILHLPDLILMDLNLPCVSGLDAFKTLRSDPRTAHIPVIALTANAMPRDIERGLAAGFYRYLTKPINIDEFTEAVNTTLAWIDRRAATDTEPQP